MRKYTLVHKVTVRLRSEAGLSLTEVLVCIAIVAIMAAYAIPSYRTHMLRAYRANAVSAVYRALQYVEHQQLNQDDSRVDFVQNLPAELSQSPQAGPAIYRITLLGATAGNGGYSVEAVPSPTGPMRNDHECGAYLLDANGQRANRINASVTTAYVARCWDGR